ncbi:GNAT family N-acetyltransferase [Virgisporangium aurantiacum]|uniref:N-acetyltransferase n=1 Tax=Virgisporangium aurantiacum TaxID=175570 RepID=A0A8J3YZP4_9ACTN|nr:GNAT family N-acetyltransferase [Virgisporangium aurantiacum]GIJ53542.1 N-acetyltransferase [Virgisporangium aurantiacum]
MSRTTFHPLTAGETSLFTGFGPASASGVGERRRTVDDELAAGLYRPEWLWVAERGSSIVARAAFWGPENAAHPWSMIRFDPGTGPDRVEVGAALIGAAYAALAPATGRPDYILQMPAAWRDLPAARRDVADRRAAAEKAGLNLFVERLNVRWIPEFGLPPRPGRLRFTPAADDPDTTRDVLGRICTDSLDAYARRDVERYGLARAVEVTIEELMEMPGGTGWDHWRLARTPDGAAAGIVLGTRNTLGATIGYLGVVPEHRGNRYSDDLVIEALHIFTAAGEPEVFDGTDVGNAPMAASFARCNYEVSGRFMVFS